MTRTGRRVKEEYVQPHEVQRLRTSDFQEGENLSELRRTVCTTLVRNTSIKFVGRPIMVRSNRGSDIRLRYLVGSLTGYLIVSQREPKCRK